MSDSERLAEKRAALARAREHRSIDPRDDDESIGVMAHPDQPQRRAEPTRESYRDQAPDQEMFTRRKRHERSVGSFDIPSHRRKPGWDYQFVTIRCLGEPTDSSRIRDFTHNGGWRPVKAGDMPELADEGLPADASVEVEGQRLYTRPLTMTREAQQEDLDFAMQQQRDRTMAAAGGNSAIRGHDGLPNARGVQKVPVSIEIESLAG